MAELEGIRGPVVLPGPLPLGFAAPFDQPSDTYLPACCRLWPRVFGYGRHFRFWLGSDQSLSSTSR